MELPSQPLLLDLPGQPPQNKPAAPRGEIKLKTVDRRQTVLAMINVEELIAADHKARAIWELTGRMNLGRFTEPLRSTRGSAGRPAWDPRLLVSVWVYAYSEGIGSAREIERLMQWDPALLWLAGTERVNHHTLSDFRVEHKAALDELFAELLALLENEGLVNLQQVMHDGTKIRTQAGGDSFRREKTLRERLEQAREAVAQLGDPQAERVGRGRKQAAQQRVAKERLQRMEAAFEEMQTQQAAQQKDEKKAEVRVSLTEPDARVMKHGDNALAPSYNAQISTDAKERIIVGAQLSQCSSDAHGLLPALEEIAGNLGRKPAQVVVDGGFTNRDTIVECAAQQIELVGSLAKAEERSAAAMKSQGIDPAFAPHHFRILGDSKSALCPAGCSLRYVRQSRKRGDRYQQYQARGEDCQSCHHQRQCCPKKAAQGRTISIRVEERAEMAAFRKKMELPENRAIYRRRGEVAEFPNAWIKQKLGLRKFGVRGLAKAGSELLWACLTYNIMQWMRLVWRKPQVA